MLKSGDHLVWMLSECEISTHELEQNRFHFLPSSWKLLQLDTLKVTKNYSWRMQTNNYSKDILLGTKLNSYAIENQET